jgi:chromosomal replication initiator protein
MSASFDRAFFHNLWDRVLAFLQERHNPDSFATWFAGTKIIDYDPRENVITVQVPSAFQKNWIEEHYTSIITSHIMQLTEYEFRVRFVAESEKDATDAPRISRLGSGAAATATLAAPAIHTKTDTQVQTGNGTGGSSYQIYTQPLNPKYTFETFVIGASNRFAHAACLAVAEQPAKNYNPLFIYGGVGLGKTHLMHAIGHHVRKRNPNAKVAYLSTERFTNDFIHSILEGNPGEFRNHYRSVDVLLIDDIQFLAKKEGTQEEFFHTFNALHEEGKQIVISSDRPPKEIPTLEDRLRSRFEMGLITDIQPPDLETRIAILQRKAKAEGLHIPDEVTQYIATQIDTNIRELEGALVRVVAFSSLEREDITLELAERALKDLVGPGRAKTITVSHIQKVVGDHFGLRVEDLKAKKRTKNVVLPRQIAMYLTRELTDLSLPRIGDAFGGRDHTTVLHACERIAEELKTNAELRATVERLAEAIRTLG